MISKVEFFKYLNLKQYFPRSLLAGHSPTCWDIFPAPGIMPEIKMTAVFALTGFLLQRASNGSSEKSPHSNRGVDNYAKCCFEIMWVCHVAERGPSSAGRHQRWNEVKWIQKQSFNQVDFPFQNVVWLVLHCVHKHGYHNLEHGESREKLGSSLSWQERLMEPHSVMQREPD